MMDYKYIEQLMERYWSAETTLEEENILRSFFRQDNIPAEMEPLRALFTDEASHKQLGDDFDAHILQLIGEEKETCQPVKARRISMAQRFMPLFKAAAVVAIILTIGGALQAPWDNSWNAPQDYARIQQELDSVAAVSPVQAENISDWAADSTSILMERSKN
jgi:hypothetical protein